MRIFPAYIVCLTFTGLIIFPIFGSDIPITEYFRYFFVNLFGFSNIFFIDGLFTSQPEKAVNGPLWTIPNELRCYLVVLIFGLLYPAKQKIVIATTMILILFWLWKEPNNVPLLGSSTYLFGSAGYLLNSIVFIFGGICALSALGQLHERVYLAISVFSFAFYLANRESHTIFYFALIFGTLYVSRRKVLFKFSPPGDFSFGIYLYGWLASQVLFSIFGNLPPEVNFLASMVVTLPVAIASWYFVESPILKLLKKRESSEMVM